MIKIFLRLSWFSFFLLLSYIWLDYQIRISSGEVAALPWSQVSSIFDFSDDKVITDLMDDHRDQSIVDKDPLARLQNLKSFNFYNEEFLENLVV